MNMVWQKNPRMRVEDNKCPKCKGMFTNHEYDFDNDMCLFCLFPEATKARPADLTYDNGFSRNQTEEGYVVENLADIPVNKRTEGILKSEKKLLKQIKKHKKYKKKQQKDKS